MSIMLKDMDDERERLVAILIHANWKKDDKPPSRTDIPTCTIEELASFLAKRGVTVGIKLAEYEKMQEKYRANLRKKKAKNGPLK